LHSAWCHVTFTNPKSMPLVPFFVSQANTVSCNGFISHFAPPRGEGLFFPIFFPMTELTTLPSGRGKGLASL